MFHFSVLKSRDGSVSIATRLWTGRSGLRYPTGTGNFSLRHRLQTDSGAHSASYPVGTTCSFPGVKWPGLEADHSPPSNAEVKNERSYTSSPPPRLYGVVLKHRNNFTVTSLFCIRVVS
jgi:hypothetical protein